MKASELLENPWAFGRYCFVLDDVRLFDRPIPATGMLGWWPIRTAKVDGLQAACDRLAETEVRAGFTLKQPYATAVAYGPKRIENRPDRKGVPPQGLWLGLHAGLKPYPDSAAIIQAWRDRAMWPDAPDLGALPLGAMLGVMHLAQCLEYPTPGAEGVDGEQLAFDLERDEPSEG